MDMVVVLEAAEQSKQVHSLNGHPKINQGS
jgi:hypothetical protein